MHEKEEDNEDNRTDMGGNLVRYKEKDFYLIVIFFVLASFPFFSPSFFSCTSFSPSLFNSFSFFLSNLLFI